MASSDYYVYIFKFSVTTTTWLYGSNVAEVNISMVPVLKEHADVFMSQSNVDICLQFVWSHSPTGPSRYVDISQQCK